MARKTSGEDGNGEDGQSLWRRFTRDITPLRPGAKKALPPEKPPEAPKKPPTGKPYLPPASSPPQQAAQPPELDRRTEARLRGGRLPIDATLDLHGLYRDEAQDRVTAFVRRAIAREQRCLLIITGKGTRRSVSGPDRAETETGILRRLLPRWLEAPDLAPHILRLTPASRRHGGDGAFYLYLRRKRQDLY